MTLESSNVNWERLAQADPFWAVATHDRYHGGRHLDDFYATGKSDVEKIVSLLRPLDDPPSLSMQSHVLDFGCGVGRLSFALADWFGMVMGVDASASMIHQAERQASSRVPAGGDVGFLHSTTQHLPFTNGEFDLAVSLLVLQHLGQPIVLAYLAELCRVVRPGGWAVVQIPSERLPARSIPGTGGAPLPHPDGGPAGRMEMYGIPVPQVLDIFRVHGMSVPHYEPDGRCGPSWASHIYFARKLVDEPDGG